MFNFDIKLEKKFIFVILVFAFIISCSSSSGNVSTEQEEAESESWNTRQLTIDSIKRVDSGNGNYGVYSMDVQYDYDIDYLVDRINTKWKGYISDISCYDEIAKYATLNKKGIYSVVDFGSINKMFQ